MMRVFSHVCLYFHVSPLFRSSSECLFRENKHTGRHLPTLLRLVCAFIKLCFCFFFFVGAFIKTFPLIVCAYINSLPFCVRFHQNVCFYPCVPTSKVCFLCMHFHRNFSFHSCAPTSNVCFFFERFHQNVSFYSCAPTSKCLLSLYTLSSKRLPLLVCVYIKCLFFL